MGLWKGEGRGPCEQRHGTDTEPEGYSARCVPGWGKGQEVSVCWASTVTQASCPAVLNVLLRKKLSRG